MYRVILNEIPLDMYNLNNYRTILPPTPIKHFAQPQNLSNSFTIRNTKEIVGKYVFCLYPVVIKFWS